MWYVRLKLTIVRAPTATPPAMADESSTRGSVSECVHDHISLADVLNGEPQQLLAVNVSWLAQALADPSPGSTERAMVELWKGLSLPAASNQRRRRAARKVRRVSKGDHFMRSPHS